MEKIPKTIHQTYMTKNLPLEIEKNIQKIKEMNPGWEHRLYDDADIERYISENFPTIYPYFKMINPNYGVVKADLFRYLVIYREGGVYLDIKSSFSKPFTESLYPAESMLLSHWNQEGMFFNWGIYPEIDDPKGEYQQCFIIAVKGHPFLKAVIEKVVQNIKNYKVIRDGVGRLAVLRLSGPIAYTLAIKSVLDTGRYRIVNAENDLGYIYNIYLEGQHQKLFTSHYSKNRQPIVLTSLIEKILLKYQMSMLDLKKRFQKFFQN